MYPEKVYTSAPFNVDRDYFKAKAYILFGCMDPYAGNPEPCKEPLMGRGGVKIRTRVSLRDLEGIFEAEGLGNRPGKTDRVALPTINAKTNTPG